MATLVKELRYKPDDFIFFSLRNPSGPLGPGAHSASKRNEYQKQKNNVSVK
jgi:hypothetical protein